MSASEFPLRGVIGIVANDGDEAALARQHGLQCVEIRADLLLAAGHSIEQLLAIVAACGASGLATLFTLRHPSHGGSFSGSEDDRVSISRQALAAGASVIDLEYRSAAAERMLGEGAPLVLSHHDFEAMPTPADLAALTAAMEALSPAAIKVVPTAAALADAVRMLEWIGEARGGVRRIGFAMGSAGACSRILTIARGAPITYASFGASVAPGQVPLRDLREIYRADTLDSSSRIAALVGEGALAHPALGRLNAEARKDWRLAACVPLQVADIDELASQVAPLRIDAVFLDRPFVDGSVPGVASERIRPARPTSD